MPCLLRLFNSYSPRLQHTSLPIISFVLAGILVNVSQLLYMLAIRVVYGFGIRLHGMCEVWKPQPHAVVYHLYTTLCSAISLVYHGAFDLYLKCGTYNIYCILHGTAKVIPCTALCTCIVQSS